MTVSITVLTTKKWDRKIQKGMQLLLKPEPGLILQAACEWNVDLEKSYMIGDHNSDVEAGQRAGVTSILSEQGMGTK